MSDIINDQTIHFTIGPVQGFLAQARRTRDLWSGSFLLSYLSGCAMAEIRNPDRKWNGTIRIPDVTEDPLLRWIEKRQDDNESPPRIGTLPNRFQATAVDPAEAAKAAVKCVKSSWKKITDKVWNNYVESVSLYHGEGAKEIWKRQVDSFWEIYWTLGDLPSMEARKNWRFCKDWSDRRPTIEGGDHCTIMGDWQEISGYVRAKNPKEQKEFWSEIRSEILKKTGGMDLRPDERLCSIALIKRMFPKISEDVIGWNVDADRWPSTLYVATIPWLNTVLESPELTASADKYARKAIESAAHIERKGLSERIFSDRGKWHRFLEIDGNFYFKETLNSPKRTPLKGTPEEGEEPEEVRKKRKNLIEALNALYVKSFSIPSPFYGMLLMDGDSMGALLRQKGIEVSKALARFTKEVDGIISKNDGVLIYAGGDDVLAMLPSPRALSCAHALSKKFEEAFLNEDIEATISAGVVFASYQVPLRSVMHEAHSILDDIAKEENNRGSIAVSVLKNSGKYCQWVSSWEGVAQDDRILLEDISESLKKEKDLTSSFFYKMRDLLVVISGESYWRPGTFFKLKGDIKYIDIDNLFLAEYLNAFEHTAEIDDLVRKNAERNMEKLLTISRRHKRGASPSQTELCSDGALLVKFLSQKGESE